MAIHSFRRHRERWTKAWSNSRPQIGLACKSSGKVSPRASSSSLSIKREIYTIASPLFNFCLPPSKYIFCHRQPTWSRMADIKIDKTLFQERLAHLISTWKADKRNGDALFNGANSILVLMGKSEEGANFQKNNAMHVSQPGC